MNPRLPPCLAASLDANAGDEVLVRAPDAPASPTPLAGHAFLWSVFAGIVHDIVAPNGCASFGKVVSEGDTGLVRFAVVAPDTGRVFIVN